MKSIAVAVCGLLTIALLSPASGGASPLAPGAQLAPGQAKSLSPVDQQEQKKPKKKSVDQQKKKKKPKKYPKTPAGRTVTTITPAAFGMHSHVGKPGASAGSFRINAYPLWSEIQPAPGEFNWAVLDEMVTNARSWGYTDVLWSMASPPTWATNGVYFGMPTEDSWKTFWRAITNRYKGRITSWEIWNEATSRFWWSGTPPQMAQLTKWAHDIIKAADPKALVITASMQTSQPGWFKSFFPQYMAALKVHGWPIDAVAFHTYADRGLNDRMLGPVPDVAPGGIKYGVAEIAKVKMPPRIQLWDTEVNYLPTVNKVRKPFSTFERNIRIARTYLESFQYGFKRTYWYTWVVEPNDWFGINLITGSSDAATYQKVYSLLIGSRLLGCVATNAGNDCSYTKGRKPFRMVWANRKAVRVSVPRKGMKVCPVVGTCTKTKSKVYTAGVMPVKIG